MGKVISNKDVRTAPANQTQTDDTVINLPSIDTVILDADKDVPTEILLKNKYKKLQSLENIYIWPKRDIIEKDILEKSLNDWIWLELANGQGFTWMGNPNSQKKWVYTGNNDELDYQIWQLNAVGKKWKIRTLPSINSDIIKNVNHGTKIKVVGSSKWLLSNSPTKYSKEEYKKTGKKFKEFQNMQLSILAADDR